MHCSHCCTTPSLAEAVYSIYCTWYGVIHNRLTHFTKSVLLNSRKDLTCDPHIGKTIEFIRMCCGPHYHHLIHSYFNQHLPQHWIRCTIAEHQTLLRWPTRSPDLMLCDFFLMGICYGFILPPLPLAAKMNHHCNLINQLWHVAAGMGRNRLSTWHPPCHKGWAHTALMRYEQKKTCRISLSICMSCVTILSAIQVYQFYEMCQGIKNNPIHSLGIVKLFM